jgi:putative heme-binding domain-containing protein
MTGWFHRGILRLALLLVAAVAAALVRGQDDAPPKPDVDRVVRLLEILLAGDSPNVEPARQSLAVLAEKIRTRELAGERLDALRPRLEKLLDRLLDPERESPLRFDAALVTAAWEDPGGIEVVRAVFESPDEPQPRRLRAVEALVAVNDRSMLDATAALLADAGTNSPAFRAALLAALSRLDEPRVADVVLASYADLDADLQPKAIELLTQRGGWAKALLRSIREKEISADAVNVNQIRQLLASKDEEIIEAVKTIWGNVRTQRDPAREQVIDQMRGLLRTTAGDARHGVAVFNKVCAQCHTLHGAGAEVGPDLTANGRGSFEQLLSNVFDPSLVIGPAYQAVTLVTVEGRVLTGLPVENSDLRIVLKLQGGVLETIPRDEIDQLQVSELSMMPEGLEKQLAPQEIADLFAYLALDEPPAAAADP